MPLYDYECQACGNTVELMHGVHDAGPSECDRCGGQMRKLLSTPAIVFKGSGWAKKDARDSRRATTGKPAGRAAAESTAAASSSETSAADSKGTGATGKAAHESAASKPSGTGSADAG
jgi:putative FmdB family regulatory protein